MGFAAIPAVLSVVGSVVSSVGQYQAQKAQANAQAQTAEAAARAEESNARIADINAQIADNQGREAQAAAYTDAYKAMGRQRASLAQAGIISSPTGLLLQQESEANADREQSQISRQAELNSLGYDIQKSNALTSSSVSQMNASTARKSAGNKLGLIGGILGGVSQGFNSYQMYSSGRSGS